MARGTLVVPLSVYVPRDSVVHRLNPAVKMALVVAFIAVIQAIAGDWRNGLMLFLQILACVVVATLLTLTTRVSELMDTLDRLLAPLSKLGLPVATISLALSLTLRLIPLQVQAVRDVLDARKARGASASATAFGVPVLIRTIRRSRSMSDALLARGVGD